MKTQPAMKTRFAGNIIKSLMIFVITASVFSFGVLYGSYLQQKHIEEEHHILPKEFYECFVGMLLKDPNQTKVCVAYRVKGMIFDGNNNPRHREHNEEQGKRIHGIQ